MRHKGVLLAGCAVLPVLCLCAAGGLVAAVLLLPAGTLIPDGWRTYGGLTLPPSAQIIEEAEGSADFHGDRSLAISFSVSPQDAQALSRTQYPWMTEIDPPLPADWRQDTCSWQTGPLPVEVRTLIRGLDVHLNAPPPSGNYAYLFRWVDGGWWRLLAIDRRTNICYYYHVTW